MCNAEKRVERKDHRCHFQGLLIKNPTQLGTKEEAMVKEKNMPFSVVTQADQPAPMATVNVDGIHVRGWISTHLWPSRNE